MAHRCDDTIDYVKGALLLLAVCACSDGAAPCEGRDPYRTRVAASGLAAYEGAAVHIASESRFCRTTATAAVGAGGFDLLIDNQTDVDIEVYPVIGAFIDLDGDGVCNVEPAWSALTTAIIGRELTVTVSAADFGNDPYDICSSFVAR